MKLTDAEYDKLLGSRTRTNRPQSRSAPAAAPQRTESGLLIPPVGPRQHAMVNDGFVRFTAYLNPMGKPRMTQRDKWAERPCVVAYRDWCDELREAAPELPENPGVVEITAYFAIPESWSKKKKAEMAGQYHREHPDGDNVLKGACDCLFREDKGIYNMVIIKRWDDGRGPRMEIGVWR